MPKRPQKIAAPAAGLPPSRPVTLDALPRASFEFVRTQDFPVSAAVAAPMEPALRAALARVRGVRPSDALHVYGCRYAEGMAVEVLLTVHPRERKHGIGDAQWVVSVAKGQLDAERVNIS
jgi:hypothetical protein